MGAISPVRLGQPPFARPMRFGSTSSQPTIVHRSHMGYGVNNQTDVFVQTAVDDQTKTITHFVTSYADPPVPKDDAMRIAQDDYAKQKDAYRKARGAELDAGWNVVFRHQSDLAPNETIICLG